MPVDHSPPNLEGKTNFKPATRNTRQNTKMSKKNANQNNIIDIADGERCADDNNVAVTHDLPTTPITDKNLESERNNFKRLRRNSSGEEYLNSFFGHNHQLELICSQLTERINVLSTMLHKNELHTIQLTEKLKQMSAENVIVRKELA